MSKCVIIPEHQRSDYTVKEHVRCYKNSNIDTGIKNAVLNYQSTNFDAINNELRYDKPDKFKDVIKNLDKASKDIDNGKVFRGLTSDYTKELVNKYKINDVNDVAELKSKLIGKVLNDKGFMSTTRDLRIAADFARDKGTGKTTVIQIEGNKTGIDVEKYISNNKAKKEKEFLIKRNTKIKIKDVSISKTGKLILYTEIED